jgi:4-amino-4-deoxy-L-arabinose transferase-like glycosyltransferase
MAQPSEATAAPRSPLIAIALILLVATVLRLGQLNAQSLSMDEARDLEIARGGVASLGASENRFPPLYHVLLSTWLKVVPWDATGRGLSALLGVLTVLAMGGLGRELGGSAAGLWAALLAAVSPFLVWYSLEARAYALYLLVAAVALWQFAAAMKDDASRHWIAFAIACIAGAYTHYYFGLLIALAGLMILVSARLRPSPVLGLCTFGVIAAGTLPSLWLLKNDLDQPWGYARNSEFSLAALGYTYFSYLSGYTLGPSLRELHTVSGGEAAMRAAPWLAAIGASMAILIWQALANASARLRRRYAGCLVVFCIAPAAIIGIVSELAAFGYNVRHAQWAVFPLIVALAMGAAYGRPRWLSVSAVAVLLACFAAALAYRLVDENHRVEDARAVAAYITAHDRQAPTFVLSGYMRLPLAAYMGGDQEPIALPDAGDGENADRRAVDRVRQSASTGQRFWLAYTREFHGDPQGVQLAALENAFELKHVAAFAGFRLFQGTAR